MASVRKNLGQEMSVTDTDVNVYTVPADTDTVVSSVVICNQDTEETTFQLRHRIAGASATDEQLLALDEPIAGNSTVVFALGLTMAETDVFTVQAATNTVSFNVYGQENS